ncbi:MAG: histone acetyltransferase Spt10 [Lasallia pustulata]|uniref:Histone acetyltransferase Spt10 n=1 Tax=Lasallia pustulata TaxID=136370 RepID=A0A5M8PJF2_9LECA|nr:MAG: histone acetyltransferase Spt10 [Lasallia pustulata]
MIALMTLASFGPYWFQNFGAVMLLGELEGIDELQEGTDWEKVCLGSFYVKPNYPGRSSHVCNGGFLVTDAARNRGVGRLMGEGYLEWAPKLGYTYSVFNLVYETNLASCRIWDALGFKRIGRVKGCGALRSHPNDLIDAIIYGRDLGPDGEDFVSEERFDKIRFYLKHGKYPAGADRAEKSRLRSAATHYKLLPASGEEGEGGEKLMLKDKEVVADPQRQYEIARVVHMQQHGGINKTTATIAEQFHWVRIKETVSLVIKNCPDCKEVNKPPSTRPDPAAPKRTNPPGSVIADIERLVDFDPHPTPANPGPGVAAPPPPTPQAALPLPALTSSNTPPPAAPRSPTCNPSPPTTTCPSIRRSCRISTPILRIRFSRSNTSTTMPIPTP